METGEPHRLKEQESGELLGPRTEGILETCLPTSLFSFASIHPFPQSLKATRWAGLGLSQLLSLFLPVWTNLESLAPNSKLLKDH